MCSAVYIIAIAIILAVTLTSHATMSVMLIFAIAVAGAFTIGWCSWAAAWIIALAAIGWACAAILATITDVIAAGWWWWHTSAAIASTSLTCFLTIACAVTAAWSTSTAISCAC